MIDPVIRMPIHVNNGAFLWWLPAEWVSMSTYRYIQIDAFLS